VRDRTLVSMSRFTLTLLLLALLTREIARRGPLCLRAPSTVVSNMPETKAFLEPYLKFLGELARRVPRGERLTVIAPLAPGELAVGECYLVALGQLPGVTLLPQTVLDIPGASLPKWAASFQVTPNDGRLVAVDSFAGGTLFRIGR
jgi:hypothetical protein